MRTVIQAFLLAAVLTLSGFDSYATTWYVATSGNNANNGTSSSTPFQTIQKAASVVNPGDLVLVSAGSYGENVDITRASSQANRITFKAQGTVYSGGFNVRLPYYTFDGFDLNGQNTAGGNGIIYLYTPASETWILNCTLHNTNKSGVYMNPASSPLPTDSQANCIISNCTFHMIFAPNITLQGSNHIVANNNVSDTGGEGDFIRPFGANHRITGNIITNLSDQGSGGHPDFFQVFGNYDWWCKDVIFEKNIVYYNPTNQSPQICQLEMDPNGNYAHEAGHMTNVVLRNNIFVGCYNRANVDMDGTKWYNNLFYKCAFQGGHVFALGGSKGSAYGTEFFNNIFYQCGSNNISNPNQGWYQQLASWETNVSITADYEFACGTGFAAKTAAPPDGQDRWGSGGQEAHSINGGNPMFVNEAGYDFHLATNSPLFGRGRVLSGFSDDISGTPRGSSWTIGPYQLAGTNTSGGGTVTNLGNGATYYVSLTGSDTSNGSSGQPWRTIQKGIDNLQPGDTLLVGPGNYGEYLRTKVNGTATAPVTIRANPPNDPNNQVIVRQFRVQNPYQVIEGFNITGASDLNNSAIRLEYNPPVNSSYCVITNNTIRDGVFLISSNASFGPNYIRITDGNFNTAGFVPGSLVFLGADSRYWHTNHDTRHTVLSNSTDGLTMYFTDTLLPDTGTRYWVPVYAGQDNSAFKGILMVMGNGITAATNCTIVGNTFSNLFGPNLIINGDNHLIKGNKFLNMHGWYAMQPQGRNHVIRDNLIADSPNIIWFTQEEMASIVHPAGGNWYDYQANVVGSWYDYTTNILFEHNWLQHCDNQLTQIEQATGTYGFTIRSNVFVGMQAQGSFSRSSLTFDHNTFYRDSYDLSRGHALGIGGTGGVTQTNLVVTANAFVDVGSHQSTNSEGFFTIVSSANPTLSGNFVAGPETTGWQAKSAATNNVGVVVNGGDPMFVNPANPLGPDGIPFTDDDGLRPLPQSQLAVRGIGALTPVKINVGTPIAHYTIVSPLGWSDLTGTNFDLGWVNLKPHERKGVIRPYNTPEAFGVAPITVTFNASNSVDGLTAQSVNNSGITGYRWSFGDGTVVGATTPAVSHTFTTPGTWPVTLTVTNSAGGTASYTQTYRTLASTNGVTRPAPPTNLRITP